MLRRKNEEKLVLSPEERRERLRQDIGPAAVLGAAATGGIVAGELVDRATSVELGPSASLAIAFVALAVAGAAMSDGDRKQKLNKAAEDSKTAATKGVARVGATAASTEAFGAGEFGLGLGMTAGLVLGAAATADAESRLAKMKEMLVEGVTLTVAGVGLKAALGNLAPIPLDVIMEEKRKGIEFAGGHVAAWGERKMSREEVCDADDSDGGTMVEMARREQGLRLRAGGGLILAPIGAAVGAMAGPVGVFAGRIAGNFFGKDFGVGGVLGTTEKSSVERKEDGLYRARGDKLKGFSAGFDVVGLEWINLDTGFMKKCKLYVDEDGDYTLDQTERYKIFGYTVWKFSDARWRRRLRKGKSVMVLILDPGEKRQLRCVVGVVSSSFKNCVSIKYMGPDGEVHRLISRNSKDLCRPLIPVVAGSETEPDHRM